MARQEAELRAAREASDALAKLRSRLAYERDRLAATVPADAAAAAGAAEAAAAKLREAAATARTAAGRAREAEVAARAAATAAAAGVAELEGEREKQARAKRAAGEEKAALARSRAALEAAVERLRVTRHETLQAAQLGEVDLPVLQGGGDGDEEAAPGGGGGAAAGGRGARATRRAAGVAAAAPPPPQHPTGVFSQSQISVTESGGGGGGGSEGGRAAARGEADARRAARIDFSELDGELRASVGSEAAVHARLERAIHDADAELARAAPNMRAGAALAEVEARLEAEGGEYEAAREACSGAERAYVAVRTERSRRFMDAYSHTARVIDVVYKELTRSGVHPVGGKAALNLLHAEDDFFESDDAGVRYDVMPPGKRFRELEALSGGEKTIAALALLFALHSYAPAPFVVMDEVDAALDNVNVHKVAAYIRRRATPSGAGAAADMQAVVISLKDAFYDKAAGVIGVYRDAAANCSRTLTLDLDAFPTDGGAAGGGAAGGGGSGRASLAGSVGTPASAAESRR